MATVVDSFYTNNGIDYVSIHDNILDFIPSVLFKQPYNIVKKYKLLANDTDDVVYSRLKIPRICLNLIGGICAKTNDVDILTVNELSESAEDLTVYKRFHYAIHGTYLIIENIDEDCIVEINYIGLLDNEVVVDKTIEDDFKQINYYLLRGSYSEGYKALDKLSNDYKNVIAKNNRTMYVRKSNGTTRIALYGI